MNNKRRYYELWEATENNRGKFITIIAVSDNQVKDVKQVVTDYCIKRNIDADKIEINIIE